MSAATSVFGRLFDIIKGQTTERKVYLRIPDERVLDPGEQGQSFEEDNSYFNIRLSEMFVHDERVLLRSFVPLSVAITEFIYQGKKQVVPFIVGNQLLKSIDPYVQGENVEFTNTNIAGPIPYLGGDVALYVGLYRAQAGDLSRKLFTLVGGILSSFDATGLSKYLDLAGPLGNGLADLLGMKEVEFRLGKRDEFNGTSGSAAQFKSGYLAYVNVPEAELDGQALYVKDGALHLKRDGRNLERFHDADYCLIRIEHIAERGDYTALPFHKLWGVAKDLIWGSEFEKAKAAFVQLVQELAKSPDLTKKHRFHLLQAYKANFEAELAAAQSTTQFPDLGAAPLTRGASTNARSLARGAVQAATAIAISAGLPRDAQRGLTELSKAWDGIPFLENRVKNAPLTEEILRSQLKSLQSGSAIERPDPESLATALTMAAFNSK
ncbi:MAG TPA: hypothetical protein VE398_18280 [Acidobacteriota bacterium]|nr:hypothetical protein [Acidobacteriota bacterium]